MISAADFKILSEANLQLIEEAIDKAVAHAAAEKQKRVTISLRVIGFCDWPRVAIEAVLTKYRNHGWPVAEIVPDARNGDCIHLNTERQTTVRAL